MVRVIVLIIVLGLTAWLVTYLPLPEPFPLLIRVLMILCIIYELIALTGVVPSMLSRWNRP